VQTNSPISGEQTQVMAMTRGRDGGSIAGICSASLTRE